MRRRSAVAGLILAGMFLLNFEPRFLLRPALDADDASYFTQAADLGLKLHVRMTGEPSLAWTPIGTAIMAAPFVGAFGVVDRLADHPIIRNTRDIQYSWAFFGFLFGANVWFLAGVLLFWRGTRVLYPALDLRWHLLVALSSGIIYYALRRFTMSHAFEFGALAVLFWSCARLHRSLTDGRRIAGWAALAGASVALSLLIRIGNLNVLIFPPVVLLAFALFADGERIDSRRALRGVVAVSTATVVALLPLAAASLHLYQRVYPTAVDLYGRDVRGLATASLPDIASGIFALIPHLVPLVFSSEFGLLYTNPMLVIGALAVIALLAREARRRDRVALLALPLVLGSIGFSVALVLWWRSTGSAYGYRYLFVLYPIGLIGLALMIRTVGERFASRGRALRWVMLGAFVIAYTSQLLFQVTPRLSTQHSENVFGLDHVYNARGYQRQLLVEGLRPTTWVRLLGQRYPGFLASPILTGSPLLERLSPADRARYQTVYAGVPTSVYLQTLILLGLWVTFGVLMGRDPGQDHRARIPPPPAAAT